jgi:hypothetical protein
MRFAALVGRRDGVFAAWSVSFDLRTAWDVNGGCLRALDRDSGGADTVFDDSGFVPRF